MKILLLGKDGQLGRALSHELAPLGEVLASGRTQVDLARPEAVRRAVRHARPRLIVNAAAYTAVDRAESEPELARAVNGQAPGLLAQEANAIGGCLVHFSTDFVFDGEKGRPYVEEDPTNPLSAYGRTKLAGEHAISEAGGPHLVLRTSWVYSTDGDSFVTKLLRWSRAQETLRVVDDQVGSPTWARSLARHTAALVRGAGEEGQNAREWLAARAGVYHVSGRGAVSRFEWARAVLRLDPGRAEQVTRELAPAKTDDFPAPARRPAYSALDCARFEGTFGVRVEPWEDALQEAMTE